MPNEQSQILTAEHTPRWTPFHFHAEQNKYAKSTKRFIIAHAGRRSGKTEIAKRRAIRRAMQFDKPQGRFIFAAPTHRQAIKIFWDDLIAMVPDFALYNGRRNRESVSLSYRTIKLRNGAVLEVCGMDQPARIEGPPLDSFVGDEFGNMKPNIWELNVRPALSTLGRPGVATLLGVPEGRNHYFQLTEDMRDDPEWDIFTWHTSEINPEEAEKAKRGIASLAYAQEYGGEFVSFAGKCYYAFNPDLNVAPDGERILYDPNYPLDFSWDFNRTPGNCSISQELPASKFPWLIARNQGKNRGKVTCVIDEVFLQQASNTEKVCDILVKRWAETHKGLTRLFGDATGGAKKSSSVAGSDWDIIDAKLGGPFNLESNVAKSNPPVRVRINAANARLVSTDGYISTILDKKCKFLIRDFESVSCDNDGDILAADKKSLLTHISDAFSYHVAEEFPIGGGEAWSNRGF